MKKLRFISFAILATALIVVSCPRPTDTPEVPGNVQKAEEKKPEVKDPKAEEKKDSPSGIQIKISGDERIDNTSLPAQTAIKGQKWKDVKTSIEEKVKLSSGWNNGDYHIYQWRLENENGRLLSDDDEFTTDTTIYAVTNYKKFNLVEDGTAIDGNKGYLGEKPRGKIIIPEGVTKINGGDKSGAFSGCSELTSLTLPDGLTSIGIGAFVGCSGLTSIDFSACTKLTSIGIGTFFGCSGLTSITLPDGLTSIGIGAFRGCSGLTSITLPDGLKLIGESAFVDCHNLTSITFTNTDGWAVYDDQNYENKQDISPSDLADSAGAAKLLTTAYNYKYWKRN
uniref:VpsB n=1 Tax=Treponema phagedenis TaxID=162 RepID=A0A191VM37_TREPH|nr:VpsB [Treponema phagedenis]